MINYYSALNITDTATLLEIKKAYFKLVRKFPPDRHPEEFMKIREAYEVLSDENTRRQYDLTHSMPEMLRACYNEGRKALDEGEAKNAIRLLEKITAVYPDFSMVDSLLGEAYLHNENSGKAIRIFEKLVAREQNNARFVRQLAHAYGMRGWTRKAITMYHRALALDEDNISLWLGLIECYLSTKDYQVAKETIRQGLEVSSRKGWDNLELYYHSILIDIFTEDRANINTNLKELKNKATETEEDRANIAWFLATLAKKLYLIGLIDLAAQTVETAIILEPNDEIIQEIHEEISKQFAIFQEIESLEEDPSFDSFFVEMFDTELLSANDPEDPELEVFKFLFEFRIVADIGSFRKDILQLKHSYPALYNLKKEFFDTVLNPKKEHLLYDKYVKLYKKYEKLFPEEFLPDDDEEEYIIMEPYKRTEPKIGRNDPCPCGSGKKYKKCCGK